VTYENESGLAASRAMSKIRTDPIFVCLNAHSIPQLAFYIPCPTLRSTPKMPSIPMQTTISPHDQSAVCTRPLVSEEQLDVVISDAVKAQKSWKRVSIDERIQIAEKWMVSEA
jgi:hypothetical protein